MDTQYIVHCYYGSSETSYTFGPFGSEKTRDAFLDRVRKDENVQDVTWSILNPPRYYKTGLESSMA